MSECFYAVVEEKTLTPKKSPHIGAISELNPENLEIEERKKLKKSVEELHS